MQEQSRQRSKIISGIDKNDRVTISSSHCNVPVFDPRVFIAQFFGSSSSTSKQSVGSGKRERERERERERILQC